MSAVFLWHDASAMGKGKGKGMSIPTESEFGSFVLLASQSISGDSSADFVKGIGKPSTEVVLAFIHEVMDLRSEKEALIRSSPVSKWIYSQPSATRAYHALFGGKAKGRFDRASYASDIVKRATRLRTIEGFRSEAYFDRFTDDELEAQVADANSPEAITKRLREYCRYFADWNPWQADAGIAQGFSDYFYSDRARRMIADARSCLEIAERIRSALAFLRTSPKNLFLPVKPSRYLSERQMQRLDDELADFMERFDEGSVPIRRLDSTAKERALAFDLWCVFFRTVRSGRSKAIAYMLEFEGVQQQIDFRSLERMTSEWKAGIPGYRHLLQD